MRSLVIAALVSLVIGLGLGWYVQGLRGDARVAALEKTHMEGLRRAQELAKQKERGNVLAANKAASEARQRARENLAAADAARDELDRLRLAASSYLGDTGAASAAADLRATAFEAVLSECAGELLQVARKADAHANDVRVLRDSWPK